MVGPVVVREEINRNGNITGYYSVEIHGPFQTLCGQQGNINGSYGWSFSPFVAIDLHGILNLGTGLSHQDQMEVVWVIPDTGNLREEWTLYIAQWSIYDNKAEWKTRTQFGDEEWSEWSPHPEANQSVHLTNAALDSYGIQKRAACCP